MMMMITNWLDVA